MFMCLYVLRTIVCEGVSLRECLYVCMDVWVYARGMEIVFDSGYISVCVLRVRG